MKKNIINEEKIPFRIVGNIEKKGEFFGFFNYRYLELDLIKGLIKRFTNFNDYPKKPLETIPIINLNSIKKLKKEQNFYPFEIIINDEEKTKKEKEEKSKKDNEKKEKDKNKKEEKKEDKKEDKKPKETIN